MPILLKTQIERTAKTPIPACRARVGGLCGFRGAAERVTRQKPENRTLSRCAGALQKRKRQKKDAYGRFSAEERAASGEAGQSRGVVRAPQRSHLPAVRAVSGICESVPKAAKNSRRALRYEKKPAVSRKTTGFQRNLRGEHRKMVKGKTKFALWITPECKQLVDDCYADDQCQSRGEYIEKAIWFYSGFLHAEKADRYLPKVLQQILSGTLDRFAERIGRQLFMLVVEQNVNNHILASDTDIDARSYQKMRGLSMEEVKRTNGRIDFEDALLSERSV